MRLGQTGTINWRNHLGFPSVPPHCLLLLSPGLCAFRAGKGIFFPPFSTLVPEIGALRANCSGPAALAAPERLTEEQRQPCPRWAPQLYPHPILLPGAAQRLQPEAGAHPQGWLVPGKAAPPRLINNSPCSCIYRDGEGKGGWHSTSCFLSSLAACFPKPRKHKDVLNFAKIPSFSPTELQAAAFKGVFPQKERWNHPSLPPSAKKGWAGKRQRYSHPLPDESREILAR